MLLGLAVHDFEMKRLTVLQYNCVEAVVLWNCNFNSKSSFYSCTNCNKLVVSLIYTTCSVQARVPKLFPNLTLQVITDRMTDINHAKHSKTQMKEKKKIFFYFFVHSKLLENCSRPTSWWTCKRLLTAHSMFISTNPSAVWSVAKKKKKKEKSEKNTTPKISILRMSLVI